MKNTFIKVWISCSDFVLANEDISKKKSCFAYISETASPSTPNSHPLGAQFSLIFHFRTMKGFKKKFRIFQFSDFPKKWKSLENVRKLWKYSIFSKNKMYWKSTKIILFQNFAFSTSFRKSNRADNFLETFFGVTKCSSNSHKFLILSHGEIVKGQNNFEG